jgi:hypothetical protein
MADAPDTDAEAQRIASLRARWAKQAASMRSGFESGDGRLNGQAPQNERDARSRQSNVSHDNMCAELGERSVACITEKGHELCGLRIAAYRDCVKKQQELRRAANRVRSGGK